MSFIALTLMGAAITVVPTGDSEPRQAVVQYGDLNLASAAGRDVLDRRLNQAVQIVCGRGIGQHLYVKMAIRKCQIKAEAAIAPQRDLALAKSGVKLAGKF
jgi:UrcA family protein